MVFSRFLCNVALMVALVVAGAPAWAQGKVTTLAVSPEVLETGVVKFFLPRFSLKRRFGLRKGPQN